MRIFSYIIIAVIILLGLTFATLNAEPVTVNYYVGVTQLPLSIYLVICVVVGALLGMFASISLFWRLKVRNRRLNRRLRAAEKEVANLRAIPLKDKH